VDFYTNPTFDYVLAQMRAQMEKENISLRSAGRGESEVKFNHQTGVCDGIERNIMLLERLKQETIKKAEEIAKAA